MEVEFVEEVGLTAAAPQPVATPPPPSQAPEIGEAEPIEPTPAPRRRCATARRRRAAPRRPPSPRRRQARRQRRARQARAARVADRRRFPQGHRRQLAPRAARPPSPPPRPSAPRPRPASARRSAARSSPAPIASSISAKAPTGSGRDFNLQLARSGRLEPAADRSSARPAIDDDNAPDMRNWSKDQAVAASSPMRAARPAGRALRDAERRLVRLHHELTGAVRNRSMTADPRSLCLLADRRRRRRPRTTPPLEVDVVGGSARRWRSPCPAMPVAPGADSSLGRQIAEVIASDLRSTGLFTPLGPERHRRLQLRPGRQPRPMPSGATPAPRRWSPAMSSRAPTAG